MRHTQLVRDKYLKDLHEKMVRHSITFEELQEFIDNRYVNKAERMLNIRNEKVMRRKQLENLEKARAARKAKKQEV